MYINSVFVSDPFFSRHLSINDIITNPKTKKTHTHHPHISCMAHVIII